MRRRQFITLLGGAAAAWPLAARAQQSERVRRVGVLMPHVENNSVAQARIAALSQELQQLGWGVGRNLTIDVRWAGPYAAGIRKQAGELVASEARGEDGPEQQAVAQQKIRQHRCFVADGRQAREER
jgi:putative ABC transport system substrate-binding protein